MKRLEIKANTDMCERTVESVMLRELMVSSTLLRRLKTLSAGILVNKERARSTYRLKENDVLSIQISDDEALPRPAGKHIPLDILYEDEWLIIINKSAGMAVHSSTNEPEMNTVEDALYAYLDLDSRPHPVSRLDRGTTGVMTVAKCGYMHALMKRIMDAGEFEKTYVAVLSSVPENACGTISAPIGMAESSHYKRAVTEGGANAVSEYKLISSGNGLAYVKLHPKTGRTHQLRVHMAHIHCPLVGDWLYGEASPLIERAALHAKSVRFIHPLMGEEVSVSAPIPKDIASLLDIMHK